MKINCFIHETLLVLFHRCNVSSFVSPVQQNDFVYLSICQQRGFAAPLHSLQEGKSKGMRASTHAFLFLVAVTTKPNNPQGFSSNGFPPAARAPPIYRTAQARQALDRRMVLQLSAVMPNDTNRKRLSPSSNWNAKMEES
jgi:hypothetical protein